MALTLAQLVSSDAATVQSVATVILGAVGLHAVADRQGLIK